jgi:hypothetical protein
LIVLDLNMPKEGRSRDSHGDQGRPFAMPYSRGRVDDVQR